MQMKHNWMWWWEGVPGWPFCGGKLSVTRITKMFGVPALSGWAGCLRASPSHLKVPGPSSTVATSPLTTLVSPAALCLVVLFSLDFHFQHFCRGYILTTFRCLHRASACVSWQHVQVHQQRVRRVQSFVWLQRWLRGPLWWDWLRWDFETVAAAIFLNLRWAFYNWEQKKTKESQFPLQQNWKFSAFRDVTGFLFVYNNKIEQKGFVKRCNFEQGLCSWTESAIDTPHAKWMRQRAEEAWPTFGPQRDHTQNSAAGRILWAATKIIWLSFTWWLLPEPFFNCFFTKNRSLCHSGGNWDGPNIRDVLKYFTAQH